VIAGLGYDGIGRILEDGTGRYSPGRLGKQSPRAVRPMALTREVTVLRLIAGGYANNVIAAELSIRRARAASLHPVSSGGDHNGTGGASVRGNQEVTYAVDFRAGRPGRRDTGIAACCGKTGQLL
jgi:hypothetical protein